MVTSVTNPKGGPEPATAPVARPMLLGSRIGHTLAGSLTFLAFAAYASISVYRHEHYASNAFDLAVQDQTVWGYSRGEFIHNTVLGIPNLLGDHFHPILITLAPFMLIWNSAEVLLVAQAVLLAGAGIPIYLWGERELGPLAGVAFQAAYLVFWGVLAGVIYDFHHAAFAVPALSTALYATMTRRNWLLVPAVVWAMLTREDIALTLIALGLYIVVVQRRWILGALLMLVNAVWLGVLLGFVIPALGGGVAYRHWTYDALGTGPLSAATHVIRHPIDSLKLLFTPATKTRVWIGSFAAFALLPLVSPVLLVALPSFLERFWSSSPNFWSFHFLGLLGGRGGPAAQRGARRPGSGLRHRVREGNDARARARRLDAAADAAARCVAGRQVLGPRVLIARFLFLCTKAGYRAGIPWICAQTRTLACRERRPARADHLEVEPHAAGLMAVDERRDAVRAWRGGRERERRGAARLEVGRRP